VTLDVWIRDMRRKYANGKLNDNQIERLNALGMVWLNKFDVDWERCYEQAAAYHAAHGNLDVPVAYKSEGIALGKWIRRHRIDKMTGKSAVKLTEERKKKLDAIGMIWSASVDDSWDVRYNLLLEYHETHGNIDIPSKYVTECNIWLGKWLYEQKKMYKNGNLTEEQIGKLDALGVNWLNAEEQRWETNYEKLRLYKQKFNTVNMPVTYRDEDGFKLGNWVSAQRKKKIAGKLTEEQIMKLDKIDFVWDWDERMRYVP
jgi:hypothetical protein